MNGGKGRCDDLFATKDMVQISLGVVGAGIAITFVIDGFISSTVDGVG